MNKWYALLVFALYFKMSHLSAEGRALDLYFHEDVSSDTLEKIVLPLSGVARNSMPRSRHPQQAILVGFTTVRSRSVFFDKGLKEVQASTHLKYSKDLTSEVEFRGGALTFGGLSGSSLSFYTGTSLDALLLTWGVGYRLSTEFSELSVSATALRNHSETLSATVYNIEILGQLELLSRPVIVPYGGLGIAMTDADIQLRTGKRNLEANAFYLLAGMRLGIELPMGFATLGVTISGEAQLSIYDYKVNLGATFSVDG